jgi:hypothetical protein
LDGAGAWFKGSREDAVKAERMAGIMQYRPHGLSPWVIGMPAGVDISWRPVSPVQFRPPTGSSRQSIGAPSAIAFITFAISVRQ